MKNWTVPTELQIYIQPDQFDVDVKTENKLHVELSNTKQKIHLDVYLKPNKKSSILDPKWPF